MKKIKLTQGKYALVDDLDFEWLNQWRWHYQSEGYASRREWPSNKIIYMHRLIMSFPREVDHINRNRLDNRRSNLRIANRSQNNMNREATKKYKGTYKCNHNYTNPYTASISVNNKTIHLGYFPNEIDAALAYDKKAKELYGEYAILNFS